MRPTFGIAAHDDPQRLAFARCVVTSGSVREKKHLLQVLVRVPDGRSS